MYDFQLNDFQFLYDFIRWISFNCYSSDVIRLIGTQNPSFKDESKVYYTDNQLLFEHIIELQLLI